MPSYKIYLTKSSEVAHLIYDGLSGKEGVRRCGCGMVHEDEKVPPIFHNQGYFYCTVEYESNGPAKHELVFA